MSVYYAKFVRYTETPLSLFPLPSLYLSTMGHVGKKCSSIRMAILSTNKSIVNYLRFACVILDRPTCPNLGLEGSDGSYGRKGFPF